MNPKPEQSGESSGGGTGEAVAGQKPPKQITQAQFKAYVEFCRENEGCLYAKQLSTMTEIEYNDQWNRLTDHLNKQPGGPTKLVEQWKKSLLDRRNAVIIKKAINETPLTSFESELLVMMTNHGIVGDSPMLSAYKASLEHTKQELQKIAGALNNIVQDIASEIDRLTEN